MFAWLLAKRERKDFDARIQELDLKGHILNRPLLPDELIHPRLPNLARAVGAGIDSVIVARCGPIQSQLETNGGAVLRGTARGAGKRIFGRSRPIKKASEIPSIP